MILEFYIYKEHNESAYKVQGRLREHFILIAGTEPDNNFELIDDAKDYCERVYADYLERITPKVKVYKTGICRGCKALGNNCGVCEKCKEEN